MIKFVNDIPSNNQIQRAGIIPYCHVQNKNYYFLCIDAKYGSLIDPGGNIERSENILSAAIRELHEETLGQFDCLKNYVHNSLSINDSNTICIFTEFDIDSITPFKTMNDICKEFREKYRKLLYLDNIPSVYLENSYLIWISEDDLLQICHTEQSHIPLPTSLSLIFDSLSIPQYADIKIQQNFAEGLKYYPPVYPKIQHLIQYFLEK